ncbi:carboxymuconolactone decarboxylase family protein [uncultured Nisaea sp.]|jgi:4-carboxymuconolactone decarboxylase|uniref:carboxymuconolactone decarboxylase family protein n=1 Tax=uncultured Nisaea sp. TaxID=538215 RepID=UPI0030ECED75|tara:strand:- start:2433 stop:2813 length:381 start_codon:yes stop_codon:yes gene_type:complete
MDLDQLFEQGMETRKKVLGNEYVENSFNNADEFSMILQKFVTTHAWGACWGRDGLELKTRSMLNLAMLAAMGREHELRLHLLGALNNGVTKNEMAEIFIQVATYAGFPAAVTAFKVAREVFKEQGV